MLTAEPKHTEMLESAGKCWKAMEQFGTIKPYITCLIKIWGIEIM